MGVATIIERVETMADNTIKWDKDADGIVTLTLDDPTGSANVMNEHYSESMHNAVERLVAEKDSITGVVITSAKKTFFAGGDLMAMIKAQPEDAGEFFSTVEGIKKTCGRWRPWASPSSPRSTAPHWEVGDHACVSPPHRRRREGSRGRLPRGDSGLRPVRRRHPLVRMFGIQKAFMEVLSQGTRFTPDKAKEIGLVDEVLLTVEELVPAARARTKANPEAHTQPWNG